MKKHILFIINPISGTGRQGSIPDEIEKYIDTSRYEYAIRMTEYAGHATLLAKEAIRKGYNTVVAVGGDGTINEVARAVVHTSTALGIIPAGRATGWPAIFRFLRTYGAPSRSLTRTPFTAWTTAASTGTRFSARAAWASTPWSA